MAAPRRASPAARAQCNPRGRMIGINIGGLEGVSEKELAGIPISYVDGLQDRWQCAPACCAHL